MKVLGPKQNSGKPKYQPIPCYDLLHYNFWALINFASSWATSFMQVSFLLVGILKEDLIIHPIELISKISSQKKSSNLSFHPKIYNICL
jgi:hypothetical protein